MAEKKADETLTLTSPTEESLTARKHEGNMADKMVDETLTSTSTTEESSTARKHEDMSDEMNAMDTIVGAESATSKELATSKTEDGYESSSWIEDADFLKSHIEISDLEDLWQDSMISDEDNLTDVLEEQRIEAKQVLQVCTVLPVQPLSKLCHFNQMNDYAEKIELTEQNLPAFLNKKKRPMLPWYKTIYMPRCVYILHITIDLSPLEKILIFLQLCCNVSILYRDEIIQKVLPILKLPENFPLELLLHYVTCQEVSCSVGPAFSDGEDVIKSIQKKIFFGSKTYLLKNMCRSDNTDNAIHPLPLIKDKTKSLSEHPEAVSVREHVETCVQLLCDHIKQITGWTDITIKLVGSSSEGTRTYYPDEYDFILIIPKHIGSSLDAHQIHSVVIKALETIDMFNFEIENKLFLRPKEGEQYSPFVVLFMIWKGAFFKNLKITVDFVPVKETEECCNYLIPHHCYTPTEPTVRQTIPLKHAYSKYDFSVIENEIIRALPVIVRNGYTLAKAMRVSGIMEVLKPDDTLYFIQDSLCKIFSSYLLKTCLLHITKDLTKYHALEKRSDIYWASQIYAQALNFIILGGCPCFFNPKEEEKKFDSFFPSICSSHYLRKDSDATQEAGRSDETIATQQTTVESGTIPPQSTCSMDTPCSSDSADADVSDKEALNTPCSPDSADADASDEEALNTPCSSDSADADVSDKEALNSPCSPDSADADESDEEALNTPCSPDSADADVSDEEALNTPCSPDSVDADASDEEALNTPCSPDSADADASDEEALNTSCSLDSADARDEETYLMWVHYHCDVCFSQLIVIGRVLQVLAAGEPDLKIVRENFLDRVINVAFRRVKDIQYPDTFDDTGDDTGTYKWDPLKKDMQYPGDYILEAVYDEWKTKRPGIDYHKIKFWASIP